MNDQSDHAMGREGANARSSHFAINVAGQTFTCREGDTLLKAMIASGVRALAIGCRSGGCGVCRVRVDEGQYTLGQMSRAVISAAAEVEGFALACRIFPASDMRVTPLPIRKGDVCPRSAMAA